MGAAFAVGAAGAASADYPERAGTIVVPYPAGGPHMSGEQLKALAGIDMVQVPYQGGGPLLAGVMSGEVERRG